MPPRRRAARGVPKRNIARPRTKVIKSREDWARLTKTAGAKPIVTLLLQGADPKNRFNKKVFGDMSRGKEYNNLVFAEIDVDIQDLRELGEELGGAAFRGTPALMVVLNETCAEVLFPMDGNSFVNLLEKYRALAGEKSNKGFWGKFGGLLAIASSLLAGTVAVLYFTGAGGILGGDAARLRRAELRVSSATRRYLEATHRGSKKRRRGNPSTAAAQSLFQEQEVARAALASLRAEIAAKKQGLGGGQNRVRGKVLWPQLYDSEDDGRYYTDEEVEMPQQVERERQPYEMEWPAGVTSGSEGDEPDEDASEPETRGDMEMMAEGTIDAPEPAPDPPLPPEANNPKKFGMP